MVDTQHFCLRWNNYQSSITSAFENLRDDEDFVDVTLACDGKSLKAHRVVLSACSPYFRELLKSTPCKHPVIVLQDVAFSDLHALVEFIYHGEVNVHQRSLSSFLKTAEVLRVSGLTQQADQTDRDELSHVRALAAGNHIPSHEKLPDEGFPRGGNSPPSSTPTPIPPTMQQIFHRSQIRKSDGLHPYDPHNETKVKRPRLPSPPLNNNDATPTDFSMIKSNHLSNKIEGNGINEDSSHLEDNIKCEPLELTGGNGGGGGNHDDSSDSGAAASDRPPASASSNEHDPEPDHPQTPSFLTPESKLFTSTPAYNFSMAALTTDHSSLSVKFPGLGHGLQTPDLAGTSQDREVDEEDGGWQSGRRTEKNRSEESSGMKMNGSSSNARNYESSNFQCNNYDNNHLIENCTNDLPIIDLLDDINEHMEIVFKTEPISPKIDTVDELETCLIDDDDDTDNDDDDDNDNDNYNEDNDYRQRNLKMTKNEKMRNSLDSVKQQDRNQQIIPFTELRPLASGQTDSIQQVLPSLHEIRRRPIDTDLSSNRSSASGGGGTYCSFCQKTFSRAWSLQRHLADTHFYVPQSLSCDQCGRSYKSRNSLVSHKSQYHAKRERKDIEPQCEISY